jgi:hypothetical protein
MANPFASLLVKIPSDRYRVSKGGREPEIGDYVMLDQGFTGPDGSPMVLVYLQCPSGGSIYEAEVYESELSQ